MSGYDPRDLPKPELKKVCRARGEAELCRTRENDRRASRRDPFTSGDLVLLPDWLMTSSVPKPTAQIGIVVDCIPVFAHPPKLSPPRWWHVNVLCTLSLHGNGASSLAEIYSFSYDTACPPGSEHQTLRLPGRIMRRF